MQNHSHRLSGRSRNRRVPIHGYLIHPLHSWSLTHHMSCHILLAPSACSWRQCGMGKRKESRLLPFSPRLFLSQPPLHPLHSPPLPLTHPLPAPVTPPPSGWQTILLTHTLSLLHTVLRPFISFQALEPDVFMSTPSPPSSSTRHRSRHKRLARSQIPSQPVEMPQGTYPEVSALVLTLSLIYEVSRGKGCANLSSPCPLQISELGIAFVGLDLHSHNPLTDSALEEPAMSQVSQW